MEINRVDPAFPIRPSRSSDLFPTDSPQPAPGDSVSISPQARLREQLRAAPDIRADRVAALRRQIEAGTYDVDGLLRSALGKILDDLAM